MNRSPAFTLLEVLLAIVLLAMVVGVCTPYLRSSTPQADAEDFCAFSAQVNETIERAQRAESQPLSVLRLEEIASSQGWRCEPVTLYDEKGLGGRWVSISDGSYTLCRWAREETERAP